MIHHRVLPVAAAAMFALPVAAEPVSKHQFNRLVVTVDSGRHPAPEFGRFPAFMEALRKAGRTCRLDRSWEYGAYVYCDAANGVAADRVMISMSFAPTRFPDLLDVDSIQPKGANGGEITDKTQIVAFLTTYLKRGPATPR